MTSLTRGVTVLDLPDDLLWPDEFSWGQVEQRSEYTITGALVLDAVARQAGRPITLQGGGNHAWVPRSTVETLFAWAAVPSQQMTLAYLGVSHQVVFDHARGAIEATPVVDYSDPVSTDDYAVTLRFIKV